jgi:hypothetical protein
MLGGLIRMSLILYQRGTVVAEHLYLRKANDDLVSHCRCHRGDALISSPGQMDCPWCGCGWLFSCSNCRKAFTFAEAVEINESWAVTAERDIRVMYRREPEAGEVEEWVEFMKILLKGVECGEQYVYFDGYVIPVTADGITIEGWHSHHQLDFVPQVAALSDSEICDGLLCATAYWQSNRVERQND